MFVVNFELLLSKKGGRREAGCVSVCVVSVCVVSVHAYGAAETKL